VGWISRNVGCAHNSAAASQRRQKAKSRQPKDIMRKQGTDQQQRKRPGFRLPCGLFSGLIA
jgi:hypothetical protein